MDAGSALGSVFAAFGLSGAAGLNAFLPLLAGAVLARTGVVDLGAPFDDLQTNGGLVALAVLFALDFVGDKIPALDHVLHVVGGVVAPTSGAALFTGETGIHTDLPTVVSVLAGGGVAGAVHLLRASIRPVSTVTTGGVGNPVLSLLEDVTSGLLVVVAFLLPVLAAVAVLALVVVGVRRRRRRAAVP
jgi:Domain of unknown function (DUF4126)